ncbi:cobalt ECF transporter T component CbiQ [Roseibium alexandrii]
MGHFVSSGPKILISADTAQSTRTLDELDPRSRVLAALCFAILTVSLNSLPVLILAFGVSVATLLATRLPIKATLLRMAAMDGFIIFMLALLPFTVPGQPLFFVFGFGFSLEGLLKAAEIGLTANAVILMLMVLVGTLEPVTLGHALHRLKTPETLVHLLMFTVRYISVLHQEYLRLRSAMKVRSFRLSNSIHTYRTIGYLVGMMLVRSIDRSERILAAMKCRGFTGTIPLLDTMRFTVRDGVFAVCALFVGTALFILEWKIGAAY